MLKKIQNLHEKLAPHYLYVAWAFSLIGMIGSLFFSEILKFAPCTLCWYQRIAMYPLVIILGLGIIKRDRNAKDYALPLAIIGFAFSIYQNLLIWGIIPEAIAPCIAGVSCTTKYISYFGFITIPFLALLAFIGIIVALIFHKEK